MSAKNFDFLLSCFSTTLILPRQNYCEFETVIFHQFRLEALKPPTAKLLLILLH